TSIPVLLGGLKTAFITSIVGMFFAILFNGMDAFFFANKRSALAENNPESVTPEHIYHELKDQNQTLTKLVSGINGDSEGFFFAILCNGMYALFFFNNRCALSENNHVSFSSVQIYHVLKEQNQTLNKLVSSINGDSEGSLIAQIKLLRTEFSDSSQAQLANH